MDQCIYSTGDGSDTLYVPVLDEYYHSAKGALNESLHVFINTGFRSFSEFNNLNILEVGFGTGLNCVLTLLESKKHAARVLYDTLEPYPLDRDLVLKLNYGSIINNKNIEQWLKMLHDAEQNKWLFLNGLFSFRKRKCKIQDVELQDNYYDLVYYDAFGPRAQPNMWNVENFRKIYISMNNGGVLVTYCAKGQVRRDMQKAGFMVERLPGAPGKREMLKAVKK